MQLYERACERRDAHACYRSGQRYEKGQGVETDIPRAAKLYHQGCDGGAAVACNELGVLHGSMQPGQVLDGKIVLETLLDTGGMGEVWRARHLTLDTPVAVKVMNRDAAAAPDGWERFQREARGAAKLRSPHVVQVLDFGCARGRSVHGHGAAGRREFARPYRAARAHRAGRDGPAPARGRARSSSLMLMVQQADGARPEPALSVRDRARARSGRRLRKSPLPARW